MSKRLRINNKFYHTTFHYINVNTLNIYIYILVDLIFYNKEKLKTYITLYMKMNVEAIV